jgi:hypothetical protein
MFWKHPLYLRWIAANAFGEVFGLGATLAVGALFFTLTGEASGAGMVLLSFGVAVASGAIEATVVGLAQWWAMHPWFASLPRRAWWLGTLVGALLAYVLGYLPSTLINLSQAAAPTAAPVTEPPQIVVLLLAAGMGFFAGALLSFAQWRVLRGRAARAWLWIPANMLAWAAGMPVIFLGIDAAQAVYARQGQSIVQPLLILALALLAAGTIVGAVHGAFLVRLAKNTTL